MGWEVIEHVIEECNRYTLRDQFARGYIYGRRKTNRQQTRPPEKEVQKAENHILYGLIYLCHSNKT